MAGAQGPPLTITKEKQLEIGCISSNNMSAEAQFKKKKSFSDNISAGPYSSISAYSQVIGNESKRGRFLAGASRGICLVVTTVFLNQLRVDLEKKKKSDSRSGENTKRRCPRI